MSTRHVIARPTEDGGFSGVYGHWDGYPSGRGKALWDCYHGPAGGDLEDMARFYIDEHPGGWSTVDDVDYKPGDVLYEPGRFWSQGRYPGACYCHRSDNGERSAEPSSLISSTDRDSWCEYAYVLHTGAHSFDIYEQGNGQWHFLCTIDLTGDIEPDWNRLNGGG